MNDLEVLPYGRTREQQDKLDAAKAKGKQGIGGCLVYMLVLTLVAVYAAGWMNGHGS